MREFFRLYPTPEACASADQAAVACLIKSLGLYNRRAKTMIKLSREFNGPWSDVNDLPGVGKYAADSWRIFVDGMLDVTPTDIKLKKYVDWARSVA